MTNLQPAELTTVVGGSARPKKDDLTLQLTTLQNTLKDLTNPGAGGNNNNNLMLMMVMAMAMKPAPTVVTAGAAPVAVAAGPVVNIRTAIRRG